MVFLNFVYRYIYFADHDRSHDFTIKGVKIDCTIFDFFMPFITN